MRTARTLALATLLAGCASAVAPAGGGAPASSLLEEGERHLAAGRGAEAETAFTKALATDPALARAYFGRGRARLATGNQAGAREDLDRWLEHDPKYALVRADLDLSLFEPGRRARRDAEEAEGKRAEEGGSLLAAFRHYAVAYALSLEEEGEGPLADALIRVWTRARPRPGYPPGLAYLLAQAQLYASQRRHEEAAVAYRQAARFCPWSAEAHYNAGMILGEYRRYGPAAESLKRARELLPEGPEAQEVDGMLITWELLGE